MRTPTIILFALLYLASFASAQNVVPVQANTNGVLLSPSPFLRTNIAGAGNIAILRSLTGNGIIISNTAGDVTLGQLSSVSNILRTNFVFFDSISSNYLYTLIVGGGAGEVNLNANAGATNSIVFGWINPKSGVTNFLKTVQPGYGMAATNQTTNLVFAVDGEVIASQPQLNTASNALRTFVLSRPTNTFPASQFTVVGGTQVFFKTAATVTNLNSYGVMAAISILANGTVEAGELILPVVAPGIDSMFYLDANGVATALAIGSHLSFSGGTLSAIGYQPASANLTNWSLFPTNIWNNRQGGSLILSNFIAMGITNIVAGTNTVIYTNSGVLVISAVPGGGGSGVISTNPNQFGASPILTLKDQARLTNIISVGTLDGQNATFSGSLDVTGAATLPSLTPNTILGLNALNAAQSIVIADGLAFTGTNLSAEVTTLLLNTASNVLRSFTLSSGTIVSNGAISHANTKQHGTQTLTNLQAMGITNIVAGTNVIIRTNAGTLVINSVPGSGGGGILSVTNFTNSVTAWSPPSGTSRIRIRAWGAGGTGGSASGANPGTGGGGGAYGESVMAATSSTSFDFFIGSASAPRETYVRLAGVGVNLMRVDGGTNGGSYSEPAGGGGAGGTVILADWGIPGAPGFHRDDEFFGGMGGGSFSATGGQGGNNWTIGVAVGYGDGKPGMTPGAGGGGGRGNIASTGGTGGLGMIIVECY